jgi:hypothetical protein
LPTPAEQKIRRPLTHRQHSKTSAIFRREGVPSDQTGSVKSSRSAPSALAMRAASAVLLINSLLVFVDIHDQPNIYIEETMLRIACVS